mmetsp:Transcript_9763/g.8722  ORF Transcript_9763/g.8722 Transcript_9763/m.8722 type:complete len:320 (-) Transcript_9763:619-1578(-)
MTTLRLALDWTPNTNHIGFYVALAKGWYEDEGIKLEILPPSHGYLTSETPARRLVNGEVDLCIGPSESLISSWTSDNGKVKPIALAAVLQSDTSAIVTLKNSEINALHLLDNKKYASYEGRFEMGIVRQMIKNNGGKGEVIEVNPPKLDCFDAVVRGEADSTWIFLGWEGLIAKQNGIELNEFNVSESKVPYGYSPLLLGHPKLLEDNNLVAKFLKVSERGYVFANNNPVVASELFYELANHETLHKLGLPFVIESTKYLAAGNHYLTSNGKWGVMDPKRWSDYIGWLLSNDLLTHRDNSLVDPKELPLNELFTNSLLN